MFYHSEYKQIDIHYYTLLYKFCHMVLKQILRFTKDRI